MQINILAIILSFLINILKRNSSRVCSLLIDKLYNLTETKEINALNEEIRQLKREKDSYNPIDEFAKYALADRKLNKILDKVQSSKTNIRTFKMKKMFYSNIVYNCVIAAFSIALIWDNYDKPIIDFSNLTQYSHSISHSDQNDLNLNSSSKLDDAPLEKLDPILFYPLNNFLSFPSIHKRNSIGVTVWLFFVNRSMEIFLNKFHSSNRVKIE